MAKKRGGGNMTTEERLENMEPGARQKRRNRWLLGAILVLLGGLIAAGVFKIKITPVQAQIAGVVKKIRANSFVLEDENGKPRAGLSMTEDGPSLELYNEKGEVRVGLIVYKDAPLLTLLDENGKFRVSLAVDKDGPFLGLRDENGKGRVRLDVPKDGPGLVLLDENGKVIWSAIK